MKDSDWQSRLHEVLSSERQSTATDNSENPRALKKNFYPLAAFSEPDGIDEKPELDPEFDHLMFEIRETRRLPRPISVSDWGDRLHIMDYDGLLLYLACRAAGLSSIPGDAVQIIDTCDPDEDLDSELTEATDEEWDTDEDRDEGAKAMEEEHEDLGVCTATDESNSRIVAIDELKPNSFNAEIFPHSLEAESIGDLAENIDRNGLWVPIDVTRDLIILNGHRRWMACRALGHETIAVVVRVDVETEDDIKRFILDSYSSTRKTTPEERVNVFRLARELLKMEHGRRPGRPEENSFHNEMDFWPEQRINAEAARSAGFSSFSVAYRADFVFRYGDAETRAKVNAKAVSLNAAYNSVKNGQTDNQHQGQQGKVRSSAKLTEPHRALRRAVREGPEAVCNVLLPLLDHPHLLSSDPFMELFEEWFAALVDDAPNSARDWHRHFHSFALAALRERAVNDD